MDRANRVGPCHLDLVAVDLALVIAPGIAGDHLDIPGEPAEPSPLDRPVPFGESCPCLSTRFLPSPPIPFQSEHRPMPPFGRPCVGFRRRRSAFVLTKCA